MNHMNMDYIDTSSKKISHSTIPLIFGKKYSWTRGNDIRWKGIYVGFNNKNSKYCFDKTTIDYPTPNFYLGSTGQSRDTIYDLVEI